MDVGRTMLGRRQVMHGVPELVTEVQVEGTFPDGTKLVTLHHPIVAEHGDLALALYGSFLPVPDRALFPPHVEEPPTPGAIEVAEGEVVLHAGRPTIDRAVTNTGDRPIQVGSHYPFVETNAALAFERAGTEGHRLDIAAGTAVRFEPGETRTVRLVQAATGLDPAAVATRHAGGAS